MYVLIFLIMLFMHLFKDNIQLACPQKQLSQGGPARSRCSQSTAGSGGSHRLWPDTATPPRHRVHPAQQLQKHVCWVRTRAGGLGMDAEGSPAPGKHPPPLQLPASLGLG